ncbi:MAG: hypothetical protein CML60_01800 [Rhodobacteraceae bacterium]|nr:hypothetical protein [Paracoccaceae bacterium]MBT25126.1 hypothetical protein [Paracoccaceae bacterium]|tara:strand:+ start:407 stop:721 length:315 start_codon:yes stop_codon:yes gene_type:complete
MVYPKHPKQSLISFLQVRARDGGTTLFEYVQQMGRDEKAALRSDEFDAENVISALSGQIDVAELTESENAVWLECFCKQMSTPTSKETEFFASRKGAGFGCGLK